MGWGCKLQGCKTEEFSPPLPIRLPPGGIPRRLCESYLVLAESSYFWLCFKLGLLLIVGSIQ